MHHRNRKNGITAKHPPVGGEQHAEIIFLPVDPQGKNKEAVKHGIIDEVGGINMAIRKLHELIDSKDK